VEKQQYRKSDGKGRNDQTRGLRVDGVREDISK